MLTLALCIALSSPVASAPVGSGPDESTADWPGWRGPNHNGIAPAAAKPVTRWSPEHNILWRSRIPGRGHGSPIVVGNRVLLATADLDRDVQSLLCFDAATGQQLWESVVHRGGIYRGGNKKASQASSTPCSNGRLVWINFLNHDAIRTTAVDLNGKLQWQTKISDYVVHQGYGSSPVLYEDLVIATADNKGGGAIAGLDQTTGQVRWNHKRPAKPNYPSPVVLTMGGQTQLILTGCDLVTSLNPRTGRTNWEVPGATTECVTTTVTDGTRVFTSGGYPRNHVAGMRADGSGTIDWDITARVYVPSMLVSGEHLFAVLDAGVAICRRCDTGEQQWKHRLAGTFSSSPVLAGGNIYVTNESGTTFVFAASPDGYQEIARNSLNGETFATPAVSRDRLFLRLAHREGDRRQEYLYSVGDARTSE